MKFHASVPKGLADLLADELRGFGAQNLRAHTAVVNFEGDLAVAYRACLWSRLASRILMPLGRFAAADTDRLYAAARAFDWPAHMSVDSTFAIDCTGGRAAITHTQYAALKVKDAIVDGFRERDGRRPNVDTDNPDIRFHLHLHKNQAELSLDLSGQSLHRRGYRLDTQRAPLKENLAAALLQLADWPALARRGADLLDPMCGSGTLLIEAALMAADIAPGLFRERFGLHGWLQHDAASWQALRDEAAQRRQAGIQNLPALRGFDWDETAVHNARENIQRCGLDEVIRVQHMALGKLAAAQLDGLAGQGLLITNPPYGERLGDEVGLRHNYQQLGELLNTHLPDWQLAVLTSNPRLAAFINRELAALHDVYNGPLECGLYVYAGTPTLEQGKAFANRLQKNYRHLSKMARRVGTDAWRVYDADLPEYAFAIDIYDTEHRQLVLQEYAPPKTVDALRAMDRARQVVAQAGKVLQVAPRDMHLRVRQRQRGASQYRVQSRREVFEEINEQGCRLLVNLTDYLDTGVFLDHRAVRAQLREQAAGKDFLNLFAYTCSASVYAAAGGARSTTSVDMSKTYLDWGQRNMQLNGFRQPCHRFVRDDVMAWLKAQQGGKAGQYDLIFIDPPTFSNSKRTERDFDVQRDHVRMLRMVSKLLRADGLIIFSNNYRRFKLDPLIEEKYEVRDITRGSIPEDFARHSRIHQCWELRPR